jgi:tetratricopeptide (TPR) repeat protein
MIPLIVALLFAPRAPGAALPPTGEAWQIMREAQQAFESAMENGFERRWRDVAARTPDDRRALLAAATIARMRYQYPRADSLFDRLARIEPASAEYQAAAHLGMALWRTLGSDAAHADSLFTLARSEAVAAGDPHTAAQAIIGLAKLRSRRAGPKAGLELLRDARKLLDHPSTDESAQLLCTEGAMMEQIGDTTGRARLTDGIGIARRARAYRELGACDLFMAQTAERGGYFAGASGAAREAVELFARIHFPLGVATASQWLGYALLERGYFAAARVELERAVSTGQRTRYQNVEAWARSDLADLYLALGDLETARSHAVRAAELHSSYGDLWGLAIDLQFEGQIAQARGQLDEASAKYTASIAAFGRAGLGFNATSSLRLLALAQMSAGHLDSAQRALNEASRLARASANTGWSAEAPVHLARLAMLRGDYRTADSLVSSVRSHYGSRNEDSAPLAIHFASLEAQLALRTQRLAAADSGVAFISAAITHRRLITTDRELRAGLAQLRNGWGSLSESYPDLVARLSAAGRIGSAFRFIESVRAREIADGALRRVARIGDSTAALGELRHASAPAPSLTLDDVRRGMARDAALVVLTLGISGAPTTAIVVTSDTAIALSLAARDVIAPLVERYIRIASAGTEPVSVGRQLGAALLQPIVRVLPSRINHLQI